MKRRRSRRRRRTRRIRRGLLVLLLAIASGSCLYLLHSPESYPPPSIDLQAGALQSSPVRPAPPRDLKVRRVYPYSIVPGGVADEEELRRAVAEDEVVAQHYSDFDVSKARVVRLKTAQVMYVSYRLDGQVYWSRYRVLLPVGEKVITDGAGYARARCGNRLSQIPRAPTSPREPPPDSFDVPIEIAMNRSPRPLYPPDPIFLPREAPPVVAPPAHNPPVATKKPPFIPFFPPIFLPPGHDRPQPVNSWPAYPVPEPATLLLVSGGFAALYAANRRRKQP